MMLTRETIAERAWAMEPAANSQEDRGDARETILSILSVQGGPRNALSSTARIPSSKEIADAIRKLFSVAESNNRRTNE